MSGVGRKRRRALALGALGLLSLVGLLWYQQAHVSTSTPKTPSSKGEATVAVAPTPVAPRAAPPLASTLASSNAASSAAPDEPLAGAEYIRRALEQYESFSRFPPWSRPADGSQTHLWKWNAPDPAGQAFARDAKGKEISAGLQLDRMFAGPGEAITATVTVWRGSYDDTTRESADANVVGYVEAWQQDNAGGGGGFATVATVSFSSVPGGPEHQYVATFVPSALDALKNQVEARFVATVDPDGHPFPFAESFRYAVTEPLVVLDRHSDSIVDGSLEVAVAVDIKKLGPVMVQATLFDAAGATAIATYDNYYRPTQLGPQDLKITFFGKAIADRGIDGPYSVRALHGYVRVTDVDPPEVFWQSTAPIATGSYRASDFSNREWDSPEKTDKINQYKRMLAASEK